MRRLLSCGCVKDFTPDAAIGADVLCRDHEHVTVIRPVFVVKCRDCFHLNTMYGDAPLTARTRAGSHSSRLRHTVDVWEKGELIHTSAPNSAQLAFDDVPPF